MRGLSVIICALIAVSAAGEAVTADHPPPTGGRMPGFALLDQEQRPVRLADLQEPVVVLNFFAFWCDTWIEQLPQLRELAAQQERIGFRFVSVSVDGAWTDQLQQVCGEGGMPVSVLVDRDSRLSNELGLRHIPTMFVLDADRTVRFVYEHHPGNLVLLRAIRAALSASSQALRE